MLSRLRIKALMGALFIALITMSAMTSRAFAVAERGFNDACQQPQNLGALALPNQIDGALSRDPAKPDIDFFRYVGRPGTVVDVRMIGLNRGFGPVAEPLIGLFDSNCFQIDSAVFDARVFAVVPEDGVVIIAATQYPDFSFDTGGTGGYRITLTDFPVVKAVRGRLLNAVTKAPINGGSTSGSVELYRCENDNCSFARNVPIDGKGQFFFQGAQQFGGWILPGTYKVIAHAEQYDQAETATFTVSANEDKDLGDISLEPFPIRLTMIRPCAIIPLAGGPCSFTVEVTNRQDETIAGRLWTIVTGQSIGTRAFSTTFQAGGAQLITLDPLTSKQARFSFVVPGDVSSNANICVQAYFGQAVPGYFFETLAQADLFCVSKIAAGSFRVLTKQESKKLFSTLNSRPVVTPEQKK